MRREGKGREKAGGNNRERIYIQRKREGEMGRGKKRRGRGGEGGRGREGGNERGGGMEGEK
jgi:hypothetical protein